MLIPEISLMKVTEVEIEELRNLETELWVADTRFNRNYMEQIFAEDFVEIGRSGRIHSRQNVLSVEKSDINAVLPLEDFKVRLVASDVALVTYNSTVTYNGVVEKGRRSSLWLRTEETWQLNFHQGTPYD